MHGQNIGDNQPIVVPTTQWSDQGMIALSVYILLLQALI